MREGLSLVMLAAGAGSLALWTHVRFPSLAPERLLPAVAHIGLAMLLLNLTPTALESSLNLYLALFGLVFPSLVYAFLAAVWMLRLVQTSLGFQR